LEYPRILNIESPICREGRAAVERGTIMMRMLPAVVLLVAASVPAAGKKKAGADCVVYDSPVEWRQFSIDWPVRAFALEGKTLWCATERFVASINTRNVKAAEVLKLREIGGMSAANIASIAVDRQGRVWFGGPEGAAMKSGKEVLVFTSENGLSNSRVSVIAAAEDGSVWVGTDSGANRYKDGAWKQFTVNDGLLSNTIKCLLTDVKGAVWFGTDRGISVYDGTEWQEHSMKNGLSWNETKAMAFDRRKETVWAAVGDKDVNCFNGKKWNVYMDIQRGIAAIMADSQSRIWFGSPAGLVKFNGDEWVSDPKKLGVPVAPAYQLLCDGKGNMWFGLETGVVFRANPYPF
jgi:ligand-binding sensor domain-containing protein